MELHLRLRNSFLYQIKRMVKLPERIEKNIGQWLNVMSIGPMLRDQCVEIQNTAVKMILNCRAANYKISTENSRFFL